MSQNTFAFLSFPTFSSPSSSFVQTSPASNFPLFANPSSCNKRSSRFVVRAAVETTRANPLKPDAPPRKRIVVTGAGVMSCFGTDVDKFYQSLLEGKSGVKKIQQFDCADWTTNFAAEIPQELIETEGYIHPKLVRRLDPFLVYAIVTGKKCLESAGFELKGKGKEALDSLDKTRCGILVGSGMGGLNVYSEGVEKLISKGYGRMSPFFIPYAITNMASGLLAIETGFMGPNYSISTACATGNYAIQNAANHIIRGEADLMLCGGVEAAIVPVGLGGFIACRALSSRVNEPTKASRPWDKNRDGFVMGEGAGVLCLESLDHALARGANIICEYFGSATNCDAHHITEPRQDGAGVRSCIELALKDAGITKEDVNYINAHATSTPAGDLAEFRAVRSVFTGDVSHIKMNGTKSMIGHGLGAASALEAVATVKAIQTGKVHPTINVDEIEDEVDIDICANKACDWDINYAISNSFGFGGHNSTVVFGKYKE